MVASALYSLKHLSEIEITALIKEVGLYTPILVDTFSSDIKHEVTNKLATISKDVKQLYSLITLKSPLYLPCPSCKKELVFNQICIKDEKTGTQALVPVDTTHQKAAGYTSDPRRYFLFSDVLFIVPDSCKEDDLRTASIACKEVLNIRLPFFLVELSCSLNPQHSIRCMFSLSSFEVDRHTETLCRQYTIKKITAKLDKTPIVEPTDEEKEAIQLCEMAEHTLILKKIGQYPSMADMQFFDLQKYRSLLKDHYRELTKAIGLYSSGVGIGAFVYLRRIFEAICEEAHQECTMLPGWNEAEYATKRFNEKMEYLGSYGKKVIPDDLGAIKSKLYGVMSKCVHEYSETECQELFPYIKTAIELILDQKLVNIEKQKKISELTKVICDA